MLNVGLIGIGGCGNMLANEAYNEDFTAIAVNSSCDDLDAVNCDAIALSDSGCGKDRKLGKRLFKDKHMTMMTGIEGIVDDLDVIIVAGSGDGGTGSSMVPMATALLRNTYKKKLIIPAIILPRVTDIGAYANSIECVKEITENVKGPYIIKDNSVVEGDITQVYKSVNKSIIDIMKIIKGDYTQPSKYGIMDDRDRMKLFSAEGLITVNSISFKENDFTSGDDLITKSINDSTNIKFDRDRVIKRMGMILNVNKSILSKIDRTYAGVKDYVGEPMNVFEQISVSEENQTCNIITILSGLSQPSDRFEEMTKSIIARKDIVKKKENTNKLSSLHKDLGWLNEDDEDEIDFMSEEEGKEPTASNEQVLDMFI